MSKLCIACPLHEEGCITNCMKGDGERGSIMYLGEAPGAGEDRAGRPFVSSGRTAGTVLEALCRDAGLPAGFRTNTCRCRPKDNRTPKLDEVRKCRDLHLIPEIDRTKPRLIVALGQTAAQCLTDNHLVRVETIRGTRMVYNGIPVFFTYHPAAAFRDRRILKYLKEDFAEISRWWKDGLPEVNDSKEYRIFPWHKVEGDTSDRCALDIETTCLDPWDPNFRIVSIAACTDQNTAYYRYLEPTDSIENALFYLRNIRMFIWQNGTFDLTALMKCVGKDDHFMFRRKHRDCLIALQFEDENYPATSLAHISPLYGKIDKLPTPEFVKQGFPRGWDTPANRKALKEYNCRDAVCTLRTHNGLCSKIPEKCLPGYRWVSSNIVPVVRMRLAGVPISQDRIEDLNSTLTKSIRKAELFLASKTSINLRSSQQLATYLFNRLGLPVLAETPKGKPKVDKDTLRQLEPRDKTGFIKTLLQYRSDSKLRDVYCVNMKSKGKIAHPMIWVCRISDSDWAAGAMTGRVTMELFGTLPKEGPVKKIITSRWGDDGIIVAADGSQMEMRIMAELSGDKNLMKAFESGEDIHSFTASLVYGVPLKEVTKVQRQRCKAVNFGIIYGGTEYTISRTTGLALGAAASLIKRWFKAFPGVLSFIEQQELEARKNGVIISPTGRPFHMHNYNKHEFRKAVNSPIQESANAFVTEGIRQAQNNIQRNNYTAFVFLTVYDSVVMDWRKESWDKVRDKDKWIQTVFVDAVKAKFKKTLGWDIRVPIAFEWGAGESYGDC